jgi:hypothetical protein
MPRSLLRYSAWISLVFLAVSCFSPRITVTGEQPASYDKTLQPGLPEKIIYKATVTLRGQELTGRLMLKKTDDDRYRVAWYSELGMTYLEGELIPSSRKEKLMVHNILPALDNNMFIRKFGKAVGEIID